MDATMLNLEDSVFLYTSTIFFKTLMFGALYLFICETPYHALKVA